MKRLFLIMACAFCIASCGTPETVKEPVVRPVKVAEVEALGVVTKNYAGFVESSQTTNLAFRVAGQIIDFPVGSGDQVKKGQLIASIDPRDYQLSHEAKRSAFITAKAQYERLSRLLEKEAVSQHDYEIAKTNYEQAKAELENSENQINDTRLTAPFDGTIETCVADNFQRVNVGETVVRLVDTKDLQIKFYLADYNLDALRKGKPTVWVRFGNLSNVYYKARIIDYTDISTDGSGIPVKLKMDDPNFDKTMTIKPGFSCDVKIEFAFESENEAVAVPITAVFEDPTNGKKSVWVVNDEQVAKREVEVSGLVGTDKLSITSGVAVGEKVIAAGAVTLTEGQKVKLIN